MDGTFKVCSKIFYQLYVIHSSSAHGMLPELFCLLPDKKTATYHRLFFLLKAKADGLGLNFNPKAIMVDFELAVHNVIRLVLPTTLIRGCFFHYGQALFRKLQHLKLSYRLKSNDEIRKWFRMFLGLAFVAVPHLQEAFNVIKSMDLPEQYRLKCSKFHEYFLDTWLCGSYPGDIWTHFNSSTPRTNNGCKGYNSRLSRRVVISHPNIYELITILKQEHANKAAFLVQLEAGHCPQKKRKLDKLVDERIRQYGLSYMLCEMNMKDYLCNCGDVLRSDFE